MAFRVLIIGGTGQVGAAVMRALAAEPSCAEVVMVNRRAVSLSADPRVRQAILDTAAAQFPAEVTRLAQGMVAQGDPVYGASCVGVGKGSMQWSEEQLKALEIGVVGGFARGCQAGGITRFSLLSAVGSTAKSRFRYVRVMGLKEDAGSKQWASNASRFFVRELSQAMRIRRPMRPGWGALFRGVLVRSSRTISGAPLSLNSSAAQPQTGSCISKTTRCGRGLVRLVSCRKRAYPFSHARASFSLSFAS